MNITTAIEHYINALNEQGKAETTIKGYKNDLTKFVEFIETTIKDEAHAGGTGVANIPHKAFEEYAQFLKSSGFKPATINRRIVSVRKFFEYLHGEKLISENPTGKVKTVKVAKQNVIKWLDPVETQQLLNAVDDMPHTGKEKKIRNKAILSVFLNCGLRLSELCDLRIEHVFFDRSYLMVVDGKGDKTRIIPMGKVTQEAVKLWLAIRDSDSPYVFSSERSDQMSTRAVQHLIESLATISKLDMTVHSLRHTFAKRFAEKTNGNLEALAQVLGHESIETTRIYVTSSMKEIARVMADMEV